MDSFLESFRCCAERAAPDFCRERRSEMMTNRECDEKEEERVKRKRRDGEKREEERERRKRERKEKRRKKRIDENE